MPARLRLTVLLTVSGLLLTLPSVAAGSLAPLAVPAAGGSVGTQPMAADIRALRTPAAHGSTSHASTSGNHGNAFSGNSFSGAVARAEAEAAAAPQPATAAARLGGAASSGQSTAASAAAQPAKAGKGSDKGSAKAKAAGKGSGRAPRKGAPARTAQSVQSTGDSNWVTTGHYIRSLTGARGRRGDAHWMYVLGARDAARNPGGMKHMVLLDIGGQVHDGVHLSTTSQFISYASLVRSMGAYIDGYAARQQRGAHVTIAIGTNNDLAVDTNQGIAWARQVINPLRTHAERYAASITIAGADDIEPGFRAGPVETQGWLNGYLASTTAAFVFNGSADGCSAQRAFSDCNSGWKSRDIVRFAGVLAPDRILVLPQIYNDTMALQWSLLAHAAVQAGHRPLQIVGPLTENQACAGDPSCPTMPTWQAFRRLQAGLRRMHVPPASLPYQVDLDVH